MAPRTCWASADERDEYVALVKAAAKNASAMPGVTKDDIDDMIQEAWLALAEAEFPPASSARRIARNAAVSYARRLRGRTVPLYENTAGAEPGLAAPDLEHLKPVERLAVLAWRRGISVRDIDKALGVSYTALKELIEAEYEGADLQGERT